MYHISTADSTHNILVKRTSYLKINLQEMITCWNDCGSVCLAFCTLKQNKRWLFALLFALWCNFEDKGWRKNWYHIIWYTIWILLLLFIKFFIHSMMFWIEVHKAMQKNRDILQSISWKFHYLKLSSDGERLSEDVFIG